MGESFKNITKSENNFVLTFDDHHLLQDMNCNGHCLVKKEYLYP